MLGLLYKVFWYLFISIEIDLEHLKDTVGRRILMAEMKIQPKRVRGKSNPSKSNLYGLFTFFGVYVWIV